MATLIGFGIVATSGIVMSSGSLEAEYGGAVVTGRRTGVFAQPNEYGLFCLVSLVFTLGLVATTDRWLRVVSALVCGLSGLGLMLSLSRGSWVGAIGGIVLLGYLLPQIRKGLVAATAAVVVVSSLVLVSPVQVPYLSVFVDRALSIGEERTNPFDERTAYRAEGMREWNDSPWIGQGPNSFPQLSDQIDSYARPGGAEHPHRLFLTIGSEQGVVGLLAMFGFTVAVVLAVRFARPGLMASYRLQKEQRADTDASDRRLTAADRRRVQPSLPAVVVLCGTAALGGVFVEGIADFAMRNPLSRSVVFLVFGWVLAGERLLRWERWQRWQAEAASGPPSQRQVANG
jgi:O-antigen ligase